MNTNTGLIYALQDQETMEGLSHRLGVALTDLVPLATGKPNEKCSKCKGTGAIKRGLQSKKFKPCKCVL